MGLEIARETFSDAEYVEFARRLRAQLATLGALLARPGFGAGPPTIGAELELCLVDAAARPLPENRAVLGTAKHPRATLEADRFNLECGTSPVPLAGRPFAALAADLDDVLGALRRAAAAHGGRIVAIGILPTLERADVDSSALTDTPRYRALSAGLRRLRQAPFEVHIDGDEPLDVATRDVGFEGATTSWQVHLKCAPAAFAATFNAAQIATAPVLAAAGNSPLFLGHRLWEETRVALYRQAVDERIDAQPDDWRPARVTFGHGWVRRDATELFAESVAFHPALLPALADDDGAPDVPALAELRLHHGTVWRWNRAVYDPAGGGHVRIEMRALPAGPTVADMLANAAFALGLTLALAPEADRLTSALTFGHARRNFYAAARHGLAAELLWPADDPPSPAAMRAVDLLPGLLARARDALVLAGVDAAEVDGLLGVVAARVERRTTGARWQAHALGLLEVGRSRREALAAMLERYMALAAAGDPVHTWPARG